ncbi:MAG: protein kinase [Myxococcota bacterium]
MDKAEYQLAYDLFMRLSELPEAQRTVELDAACSGNPALRAYVEQLLEEREDGDSEAVETLAEMMADLRDQAAAVMQWARPGLVVGERFELISELGSGGMATVWKARHRQLGSWHAVKILHASHPDLNQRLQKEGAFQAQIRHPNVVRINDLIDVQGRPVLIMEFIDGKDLEKFLKRYRLTPYQVDELVEGILAGMQAVHEMGITHRDLKPSNVLLSHVGNKIIPKITDFGIARQAADQGPALTQSRALLGTLPFMSPEQIRDPRKVTPLSDIWALGCMLHQMVSGVTAFSAADNGQLLVKILSGAYAPLPPDLPKRWEAAIHAALQIDPAARPQSSRALSDLWFADASRERITSDFGALSPASDADTFEVPPTGPAAEPSLLSTYTETPPNNLAPVRSQFVGRRDDLDHLHALLNQDKRLITLLGTAGLGKTRLAVELGRTLLHDAAAEWPGGVWFVDLSEHTTEGGAWSAFSAALEIPLTNRPHALLAQSLRDRGRLLLILDNAEQIVSILGTIVNRLLDDTSAVSFLITSREPLLVTGEQLHPLGQLPPAHAVELFIHRAQMVNAALQITDTTRDQIAELVTLLDRLPLAIELAASRSRLFSPGKLLSRMSRRFDLLKSRSRDLPERQRTMYATLQWSWDLLKPEEQSALRQCSVFRGGFTLEAAEEIIVLDDEMVWLDDVLAALIDKSMLQSAEASPNGDIRFSLLMSIQHFAARQLGELEPVEARHGHYYAQLSQTAALKKERHPDLDNFIIASQRAIARADGETVTACGEAIYETFIALGPFREGARFFEGLEGQIPPDMLSVRLNLRRRATRLRILSADLDIAARMIDETLRIAEQSDRRDGIYEAMRNRIELLFRKGHVKDAIQASLDTLEFSRSHGGTEDDWQIVSNLGMMYGRLGRHEEAERYLQQSLSAPGSARHAKDAVILIRLSLIASARGQFRKEADILQRALDASRIEGNRQAEATTLINLGVKHRLWGEFEQAETYTQQSLQITRQLGDRFGEARRMSVLSRIFIHQARFDAAERVIADGAKLARDHHLHVTEVEFLHQRGLLRHAQGRLEEAEAVMVEALSAIEAVGAPQLKGKLLASLGKVAAAAGAIDRASAYFQQGTDYLSGTNSPIYEGVLRFEWATVAHQAGQSPQARIQLDEAKALFDRAGLTDDSAYVQDWITLDRALRDDAPS